MNSCHFIGRLVADPELNDVNETSVVRFTLAINEYRKSRDGENFRLLLDVSVGLLLFFWMLKNHKIIFPGQENLLY